MCQLTVATETSTVLKGFIIFPAKKRKTFGGDEPPSEAELFYMGQAWAGSLQKILDSINGDT